MIELLLLFPSASPPEDVVQEATIRMLKGRVRTMQTLKVSHPSLAYFFDHVNAEVEVLYLIVLSLRSNPAVYI